MTTDPFEALRASPEPRSPDPLFAVALRQRLEEELGMTTDQIVRSTAVGTLRSVNVRVPDANQAARFFGALLGWEFDLYRAEEHVEQFAINTSILTVLTDNQSDPDVRLFFMVDDVGESVHRVESRGGRVTEASVEGSTGWAMCEDDQGLPFGLWRPEPGYRQGPTPRRAPRGEIGHITISLPDVTRGLSFYAELFGWEFRALGDDFYFVASAGLPMGISAAEAPSIELALRIDDIAAVASRVRELGGTTGDVQTVATGSICRATDDQRTTFDLWQPALGF